MKHIGMGGSCFKLQEKQGVPGEVQKTKKNAPKCPGAEQKVVGKDFLYPLQQTSQFSFSLFFIFSKKIKK